MRVLAFIAMLLFASAAAAQTEAPQTWTGPDPERRGFILGHAQENFETAITEVCFPFIFQDTPADSWTRTVRQGIAWYPTGPGFDRLTSYLVGGSSGAIAGVGDRGTGPECTVKPDDRVDLEETETNLRALIARMPVQMTESGGQFNPGAFQRRLAWCSPAEGQQYVVLASVGRAEGRRNGAVMFVSFVKLGLRDPRCDIPVAN